MSTPEQARRELNRELQEWIADPGAVVAIGVAIEALIDAKLADPSRHKWTLLGDQAKPFARQYCECGCGKTYEAIERERLHEQER